MRKILKLLCKKSSFKIHLWIKNECKSETFLTVIFYHHFFRFYNFFSPFTETTNSLRLSKLVVPSIKFRGENALLECQYELNNRSINNKYRSDYDGTNTRHYRRNNYLYYGNDEDTEETLYSVKWYKDEGEFYRYVPRANPPQNSYSFDGIKVDVSSNVIFFFLACGLFW
jgi:hypothetical protein